MTNPPDIRSAAVADIIGAAHHGRRLRGWQVLSLVILLGLLGWWWLAAGHEEDRVSYQTDVLTRGTLVVQVSATGNLQPTNQVDVGSELSGTMQSVAVDVNDQVTRGQVLAQLDTARLEDTVIKSRAALLVAQARVQQGLATAAEEQANLQRLLLVFDLSAGKVPSASEMARSEASVARAQADVASAQAAVTQAEATLRSDQVNLQKAIIRSPINGVVLARNIEPGQTVAASFAAPVLFTLAEDLAQMELQVAVDEADVGQVQRGQQATFTVDAYANRSYPATVSRVSYGAQVVNNVVSYLTILQVNNTDLSLRPGMTATAEIITLTHADALLVANAALRYVPPPLPDAEAAGRNFLSRLLPRRPGINRRQGPAAVNAGTQQQLWLLRDGQPVAMAVTVGATDGRVTEILAGDLQAGAEVITDSSGPGAQ